MRVRPLPKSWLIHTIIYHPPSEEDDWGNVVNPDPIEIKYVRYDQSTVFSRDSNQTKIVADGIIFIDTTNSSPIPDFVEDTTIMFGTKRLTLKKIVPCYFPMSYKVRHWELEVI